jgi:2-C-methyl-D-erythritol 4-phosphate cytidylyltransferase/2-C-methyl-D-erythritol 2,4-cyclodiphosphate synthase
MVCVGAGRGSRFGSDKLAERIGDHTVLELSLLALRRAFPDAPLVVVLNGDRLDEWRERLEPAFADAELLAGGRRRQDSVRTGVTRSVELGADVVLVHDAARPLADSQDIKGVAWALGAAAGSVLCDRVTDTVKRVDTDGLVLETVPRDDLRLAQTPQVFQVSALLRAWDAVDWDHEWTDEAAMLESLGMPVRSVVAQRPNPKLTTDRDLQRIRYLTRNTR